MRKIRKGDQVVVLVGRSKGHRGVVTKLAGADRVIVEHANMIKRHTRGNPRSGSSGGIIEKEASIHISNVALFNAETKKPSRVGVKRLEDGRRVRYLKASGETIDLS
ncbi:MAG: 50S ribosomal protein L24 [Gammaproteobacteria bacterium]